MPEHEFTLEEANAALGHVADAVEQARRLVEDHRRGRGVGAARVRGNGHRAPSDERTELQQAVAAIIQPLHEEGIVVRDLERGLVDFPARSPSGRLYWLCWVIGEPAVEWWHWPEDGFAGRTPISQPPA